MTRELRSDGDAGFHTDIRHKYCNISAFTHPEHVAVNRKNTNFIKVIQRGEILDDAHVSTPPSWWIGRCTEEAHSPPCLLVHCVTLLEASSLSSWSYQARCSVVSAGGSGGVGCVVAFE